MLPSERSGEKFQFTTKTIILGFKHLAWSQRCQHKVFASKPERTKESFHRQTCDTVQKWYVSIYEDFAPLFIVWTIIFQQVQRTYTGIHGYNFWCLLLLFRMFLYKTVDLQME